MTRKYEMWLCVLSVCSGVACDWDLNRTPDTPPRVESSAGARPVSSTMPLTATTPAEQNARPSMDQNMGRDFQGALELELRTLAADPHEYAAENRDQ